MKTFSRADFFLQLSDLPQPDRRREEETARGWSKMAGLEGPAGLLETVHSRLSGLLADQRDLDLTRRALFLFASDHALLEEGGLTSAEPAPLAKTLEELAAGKHPVSRLASLTGTRLVTVNLGIPGLDPETPAILHLPVADQGTSNMLKQEAMTEEAMMTAIRLGMELASQTRASGLDLLLADTVPQGADFDLAALLSVLFGRTPEDLLERGPDLPDTLFQRRAELLTHALEEHSINPHNTLDLLRQLGSLELAGLTGLMAGAALYRLPVLLGGTSSLTAALILTRLLPQSRSIFFASHQVTDPGGQMALRELGLVPLADHVMPGPGVGGALYLLPMLDLVCQVYRGRSKVGQKEGL